jgi:thioredoxin 1
MEIILVLIGSTVALIVFYFYYKIAKMKNAIAEKDHEHIRVLTTQNFQNQIKTGLTLVDFWAEWCMPCKMMIPVLNSLAEEVKGETTIGKINIEQHQSVAAKYNVRSIPTMILFKNGKEHKRYVGVKSKDFLMNQINQNK